MTRLSLRNHLLGWLPRRLSRYVRVPIPIYPPLFGAVALHRTDLARCWSEQLDLLADDPSHEASAAAPGTDDALPSQPAAAGHEPT